MRLYRVSTVHEIRAEVIVFIGNLTRRTNPMVNFIVCVYKSLPLSALFFLEFQHSHLKSLLPPCSPYSRAYKSLFKNCSAPLHGAQVTCFPGGASLSSVTHSFIALLQRLT